MHKSLFVIIAIAALLVVAGCGNKEVPKTESSDTAEKNTADTTAPATTEIDDEELSSLDSSELDSLDQDLAVI